MSGKIAISGRTRLDRWLSHKLKIKAADTRLLLAQRRVVVDGVLAQSISQPVDRFSVISVDEQEVRNTRPVYVMLNKPMGVVSATRDEKYPPVIDLLDRADKGELHVVGRQDFNSTGLILLTNDGRWSQRLTSPDSKVSKRYQVGVKEKICPETVKGFVEGIYFHREKTFTRPAGLKMLNDYNAEVILTEGRYHQIKRMFGHFNNEVLSLYRSDIGPIQLDTSLQPGQSRELCEHELARCHLAT